MVDCTLDGTPLFEQSTERVVKDLIAYEPLADAKVVSVDVTDGLEHAPGRTRVPRCDMRARATAGPRAVQGCMQASERARKGTRRARLLERSSGLWSVGP